MRIIRGKYKGRHIPTPTNFKARPTTDFAKEGLFNILENVYIDFDASPTALDLFAGTGSIGLELASRGCGKVVSVEKDFKHWQFLARVQKELQAREFSADAGGGMVSATVTGARELKSITINPACVDPDDVEMLQDLVCAAVNEAMRKASEEAERVMGKITGGMNLGF